jgi:hypothetical protein
MSSDMSSSTTATTADQEQEQEHDLDYDPEVASIDDAFDHPRFGDAEGNTQDVDTLQMILCPPSLMTKITELKYLAFRNDNDNDHVGVSD